MTKTARRILLLASVAMLVVATATPVDAGRGADALPLKGEFSGRLVGFDTDPEHVAPRCDDSPDDKVAWAVTSFEGWGNVTHLGRTYALAEHCSYSTDGVPDGTYGEGELTMIAANGDVLRGTYADGASLSGPPDVQFQDFFTFVDGGTGRFATASGGGLEFGVVHLGDGSAAWRMEGVISYKR
jgi:hypothetical protein